MSRYPVEVIYTNYIKCEASKPNEFNLNLSVQFDLNFGRTDRHALEMFTTFSSCAQFVYEHYCREHFRTFANSSYIFGHAERTLRKLANWSYASDLGHVE